eukprot:scpid16138/ scgid17457/ 
MTVVETTWAQLNSSTSDALYVQIKQPLEPAVANIKWLQGSPRRSDGETPERYNSGSNAGCVAYDHDQQALMRETTNELDTRLRLLYAEYCSDEHCAAQT